MGEIEPFLELDERVEQFLKFDERDGSRILLDRFDVTMTIQVSLPFARSKVLSAADLLAICLVQ